MIEKRGKPRRSGARMDSAARDAIHTEQRVQLTYRFRLKDRHHAERWTCGDRDVNAARNITRVGLDALAEGAPA